MLKIEFNNNELKLDKSDIIYKLMQICNINDKLVTYNNTEIDDETFKQSLNDLFDIIDIISMKDIALPEDLDKNLGLVYYSNSRWFNNDISDYLIHISRGYINIDIGRFNYYFLKRIIIDKNSYFNKKLITDNIYELVNSGVDIQLLDKYESKINNVFL